QHYVAQSPWKGAAVETIYFGGGTPSLFAPASLERFLRVLSNLCPVIPSCEMTLEADPASVTPASLAGFRAVGINRLSLCVQSFQPTLLKTLGGLHSAEDGAQVLAWAREAGFANVNMDLIFGVPGQTLAMLASDLDETFRSAPAHIALYNLTYEEGTPFLRMKQKGKLKPVDE